MSSEWRRRRIAELIEQGAEARRNNKSRVRHSGMTTTDYYHWLKGWDEVETQLNPPKDERRDAFKAGFEAGSEWGSYDLYLRGGRSDEEAEQSAWEDYNDK